MRTTNLAIMGIFIAAITLPATEFHVATNGNDADPGTLRSPLRTIQRAADLAQPGDVVTVHAGTYRERVSPPRGGESETRRIVYQAAPGEKVEIKGSEIVKGWMKVQANVWKATLPNSFFGSFNPYDDLIRGDWFDPRSRAHHTGAVYLNGEWLIEAAKRDEVLMPAGTTPEWLTRTDRHSLLNVAWLRPNGGAGNAERIPANGFAAQQGIQTAPCLEGGECIGWIEHGDWVRYGSVNFGQRTEQLEIRAASATDGGIIEVRLDTPEGERLGICSVPNTGGWQSWSSFHAKIKPVAGIKTLCLVFRSNRTEMSNVQGLRPRLWFAEVDKTNTTIWAQFDGADPNGQLVEVNVRRSVFYPEKPGMNYITVRGFALRHAATPWAPPTAEQVGLIGTHWSKGWIIESNTVSHSTCAGIALGKYGDQWDNTSADTAEGYVKTIERALVNGWNHATIGHHLVRNNTITHCEQAGIVGSLGAAFSTVTGNTIHDIHVRRLFSGAEMAGIKFHAAIDTTIRSNHIYRTCRGLWLDWMAQGTRVAGNLFHDNAAEDLFVEVNHGPFLVDNNLFLSAVSLLDVSEGGAYVHNLFTGKIISQPEPNRATPYHPPHTTALAGLVNTKGGDDRFFNNLFVGRGESAIGFGLQVYDNRGLPLQTGGNVYFNGARPYANESNHINQPSIDPNVVVAEEGGRTILHLNLPSGLSPATTVLVNSARLGRAKISGLPYENADGSPLKIDADYFGEKRDDTFPSPGPFEKLKAGPITLKVW